ncbi:MAG: hypothetical protein HC898_02785 [Phycisphaerales bacterium]|nr:hypothetical protein [Phycisphaerales bacterium]
MPPIDEAFSPPTPEQVTDHLQQHPLRGPSKLQAWIPIIGFGLVLLLVIIVETGPALLLPWLLILALMFYSSALAAHIRRLHQQVTAVQELAMLRHYPQSLRLAWRTLPRVTGLPEHYLRLCA